jgi:hypothetical protein
VLLTDADVEDCAAADPKALTFPLRRTALRHRTRVLCTAMAVAVAAPLLRWVRPRSPSRPQPAVAGALWSGMRLARKREWGYVNLSITIPGTGAGE